MSGIRHRIQTLLSRSFVRTSAVYLAGNILNAALPFVLLPVLTRYLSPEDYGMVATSIVLLQIFNVILGINAFGLISRSYFDDDPQSLTGLVSTSLLLAVGLAVVVFLCLMVVGAAIEEFTKFPANWMLLVVVIALASVVQTTYLSLLQVRNEPGLYILIQTVSSVINLGLSVWLVVGNGLDWRGRIIASAATGLLIAVAAVYGLAFKLGVLRLTFTRNALESILRFGVPLIPHFLGGWVMTMSARLYLNNMASVADTGLYSVGFSLASPIALIVGAANQAYVPALFKALSATEVIDKLRLAKILILASFAVPIVAIVYSVAIALMLPFIVGPEFLGATPYIGWLSVAFAVQGVYFVFGNLVVYTKRTVLVTWRADFLGGIATLVACPILIYMNGATGAAQATLLGFVVSCVGCFTASRIAYPLPWKEAVLSFRWYPRSAAAK
jgi:O-antigen/teichoic acid export membrane protein